MGFIKLNFNNIQPTGEILEILEEIIKEINSLKIDLDNKKLIMNKILNLKK